MEKAYIKNFINQIKENNNGRKIKELKEKFKGSNKYMLTLSYEDIKELFAIIDFLKKGE